MSLMLYESGCISNIRVYYGVLITSEAVLLGN